MQIIQTNLKFKFMMPRLLKSINKIIIHHSAADNLTPARIHQEHLNFGWAGAGYNYCIDSKGVVYKLRPERYVGSHCQGQNSTSIGICVIGDFTKHDPTDAQIQSLKELVEHIENCYIIKEIGEHRDYNATACPVYDFKQYF